MNKLKSSFDRRIIVPIGETEITKGKYNMTERRMNHKGNLVYDSAAVMGVMTIGLERGIVRLVTYTAQWATLYREEESHLREIIGAHVIDIQHIGSTSIPGMIAKPILNIGVAISRFEEGFELVAPIESLGYEYVGEHGIPRRHYYNKADPRTHHLHMLEHDSSEWRNCILFRDYLRTHAQAAQEYAELKRALARRYRTDRTAYTDGKAEFIVRVLEAAEREAAHGSAPMTRMGQEGGKGIGDGSIIL
jgi:GrpB-like predicted nucleotidyltransferase (UPF0157 family)